MPWLSFYFNLLHPHRRPDSQVTVGSLTPTNGNTTFPRDLGDTFLAPWLKEGAGRLGWANEGKGVVRKLLEMPDPLALGAPEE